MIPPVLAAQAASVAMNALSSVASAASSNGSSSASSSAAAATTASTASSSRRNDALGQTEFLTLLVAQLQNQDPLNPLDSADFSAQLAQFSSLEQLMQINERIAALADDGGAEPAAFDPVGLLGRDVVANGDAVTVSGGEASTLEYALAEAGTVTIEVRGASGNLISTAELGDFGAGTHVLDLDDVATFADLADGSYTVSVSVRSGANAPTAVATRVTGTVSGVDLTTNPPTVRIGGLEIPLGDVREVRASAATA